MQKRKVVISTSSFGAFDRSPLDLLEAFGAEYTLNPYGRTLKPEESIALLADADALIAGTEKLDATVFAQAPRLRVVSRVGTGMDNVDMDAANASDIKVFNTPSAHVDAVAELALGGMLDLLRHVSAGDRTIKGGGWNKAMGRLLRGKTVGLIGMGRVGRRLVELLAPFHVRVLAVDPGADAEFAKKHGVELTDIDAMLPEVDILTLHIPLDRKRGAVIGAAELARMKADAVLVNTARGGLVDEDALASALRDGKLAGAFLDTFAQEPYSGALAGIDNCVLTPHVGSYAMECRVAMETEAVENMIRGFREAAAK